VRLLLYRPYGDLHGDLHGRPPRPDRNRYPWTLHGALGRCTKLSTQNAPSAHSAAEKRRFIEAILDLEMPQWRLLQSIELVLAQSNSTPPETVDQITKVKARRAQLDSLTLDQIKERLTAVRQARAKADEARRFYNAPEAQAQFDYWLGMDFWTLDEAVALLLGKNPQVVNAASIDKDLEKPKGFFAGAARPPTQFTNLFKAIHLKAQRSSKMTGSKHLTPLEVAQWGKDALSSDLPAPLAALLAKAPANPLSVTVPVTDTVIPVTATASEEQQPTHTKRTLVSKAALMGLAHVWHTVENNLHHAQRNGLAAAAKAQGRNKWWKESAIEWAMAQGKIAPKRSDGPLASLPNGFFSREPTRS